MPLSSSIGSNQMAIKFDPNHFNPVDYSIDENKFIIAHAGEPWVVAGRDIKPASGNPITDFGSTGRYLSRPARDRKAVIYPDGVTPAAVRPVLERIEELLKLEKHEGQMWVGVEAVKQAAQTYIDQQDKWVRDNQKGAPRFPSMHNFDPETGRPIDGVKGGSPGTDSGRVKTYFRPDGSRAPFQISLIPSDKDSWVADWAKKAGTAEADRAQVNGLNVDRTNNRIECMVCGRTESFNPDSRLSLNAARGRMSRHLRNDTKSEHVEAHRKVYLREFNPQSR
jgi:hypothetical protein